MPDQTLTEIRVVQEINKAKAYEDRKEMRNELINFIEKCDTLQLSKLYDEYKRNKK